MKKVTKGRHVTLQPTDAGMACGFLGQGRLCSLSLVLKEKLIKQIKESRGKRNGLVGGRELQIVHPRMNVGDRRKCS